MQSAEVAGQTQFKNEKIRKNVSNSHDSFNAQNAEISHSAENLSAELPSNRRGIVQDLQQGVSSHDRSQSFNNSFELVDHLTFGQMFNSAVQIRGLKEQQNLTYIQKKLKQTQNKKDAFKAV